MSSITSAGRRLARTFVAVALGSTVLTSCNEIFAEPTRDTSCAWLSDTDPADKAGHTVVLVDRSASVEGGETPDFVKALDDVVRATVNTHDVVSIGTFDGSAATVRWNAEALVTDRSRKNPELRRADDKKATECLLSSLQEAVSMEARTPGTDVMGALTMGGRVLRDARGPKKVVVATDGLSTTGCTDLTHASISDYRAIEPIRKLCEQTIPKDSLSGVAATLVGIGHPATDQPHPSTQQLEWLGSLWITLCESTGAQPCEVSTEPVPVVDGGGRKTTQDDPRITFPPPEHGVRQLDGSTRYQLDSQVLFAPNDATISANGRQTLTSIAGEIAENGTGVVTVDGYTEAQATPDANRGLAQARANEVRDFLAELHIDVTNAVGHPDTAPDCAPNDRQCKRRVDIVFSPTPR